MGHSKYQTDGDERTSGPGFGVVEHWTVVEQPLSWRKPKTIFVNSMSDLAHPKVSDEFIAAVYAVMSLTPRHRYQVLTKRPRRLRSLLRAVDFRRLVAEAMLLRGAPPVVAQRVTLGESAVWPPCNVWLGVSTEDDLRTRERLAVLAETPSAVRFVSAEPLLEDISAALHEPHAGQPVLAKMDWVIVGGESGPHHRPMQPEWVDTIRQACLTFSVPFFFKQWGGRTPKAGGRQLAGTTWDEMPRVADVGAQLTGGASADSQG